MAPSLLSRSLAIAASLGAAIACPGWAQAPGAFAAGADGGGLTAVAGLRVGHYTMPGRPTGCTVVLTGNGIVGSVDVRGGAPATKETSLLDPVNLVQVVHAVVLSGGSAFGLDAATGTMQWLEERGIGFETRVARVPIVPAASLYDLAFGGDAKIRPNADCGYQAANAATDGPVAEGNVGAGAGATVGKTAGPGRAMKAGIGSTAIKLPNGLVVAALVAVNAVGDIIDPATGRVVAGVRTPDGKAMADARLQLRQPPAPAAPAPAAVPAPAAAPVAPLPSSRPSPATTTDSQSPTMPRAGENTTIGVVATNAKLTKVQAQKMAQMAHDGYARAISPVHTPSDGDTVFSLATGRFDGEVNLSTIGALAAEAMAEAIVRAATRAEGSQGVPAARDLRP